MIKKILCQSCNAECFVGKKKLCNYCYSKSLIIISKERKKIKLAQPNKSIEQLDEVFSKLVKTIYPLICHSTKKEMTWEEANSAHFIPRGNHTTRWDLRNVYPTTQRENYYNKDHVLRLADCMNLYYGIDSEAYKLTAENRLKISQMERNEMFDIFEEGLKDTKNILKTFSKKEDILEAQKKLRIEIINKTKKIM